MKIAVYSLCLVVAFACATSASDAGHFMPKAFFTLDSNGQKANLHPVSPHTANYLRRMRRESTYTSSSSSSSSVSTNGGPTYFTNQQVVHSSHEPEFASRFGGPSVASTQGGSHDKSHGNSHGVVVQTTGVIDDKGKVVYHRKEGHF